MTTHDVSKRIAELSPERRELLLQRLRNKQPAEAQLLATLPTLVPDPEQRDRPFPLTDVQQNYWIGRSGFFDLGVSGTNIYEEIELAWAGDAFVDRLNLALQQVIARNEMLRAIILPDGQQQILPEVPAYRVPLVDLRGQDPQSVATTLAHVRRSMRTRKGPLDQWPLFEIRAHRLDGERLRVHMRIETFLMDGDSRTMFLQQLFQCIEGRALPPLECSYRDYALTWAAFQESTLCQRARDYWLNRLPSLPPAPELPLAQLISPHTSTYFVDQTITLLEPHAWQRLKARAGQANLTPSGVVAAAFVEILATWSASSRFTVSMIGSYRPPIHPQIDEIIGNFNTIYLLEVAHEPGTFEARARRLQQQMLNDLEYRNFSGFQVLRELNRMRGGGAHASMPILFNSVIEYSHSSYRQSASGNAEAHTASAFEELDVGVHIPQVLLLPTHREIPTGALVCKWQVAVELFTAGLTDDMLDAYARLLQRLADQEEAWQTTTRQLLPTAQLEQRAALNATAAPLSELLLHELFAAQAAQRPDQAALVTPNETLTYGELARRVTYLSHQLRTSNVGPGVLVAVLMEQGWQQVVAVLGVLQAGAAYLPIDPAMPSDQLCALLNHDEVKLLLTQSWLAAPSSWPEHLRRLNVDLLQWAESANTPAARVPGAEELAYVIFTAGTTGQPKGVLIDHRGVANTIHAINQRFNIGPGDRILGLAPLHSDLAVYDIFGTLAAGGMLVIPEATTAHEPAHWAELMADRQVTIWNSTPALLDRLVIYVAEHPALTPHALRLALLSRDWMPLTLPGRLKALIDGIEVISLGGTTETSIWSSLYPIETVDPTWKSIPYGKPMLNQQLHVLNASLEPVPVWVPAQIYIGGVGLAKGYWHDAKKTDACFVIHPQTGERLYRTDDLGYYLPDGNIVLLGREQDIQTRIHGYRVEPRQVEAVLEQHPAVRNAIVLVRQDARANQQLIAYLVTHQGMPLAHSELGSFLTARLPAYLLPSAITSLPALPLTSSGKVARHALPASSDDGFRQPQSCILPRNSLELQLAHIWEDLLERHPIGVADNFFDIGGNSLLTLRLLTRIQELFGQELALAAFFQEATVEHLARIINDATT